MNIIGHKKIYLIISGLLVAASIAAIAVFGFKQGIDFSGGTLWQIQLSGQAAGVPEIEEIEEIEDIEATQESKVPAQQVQSIDVAILKGTLEELGVQQMVVTTGQTENSFLIRTTELTEEEHQGILAGLTEAFGPVEELSFETIGSVVGGELQSRAVRAFIFVLIGISLYIAFAFRKVSRPIRSWQYGITTLITLFHDALIPAGLFALLGHYQGVEVGTQFIVALLVVMGFSVHDTIVVFDRVRENLRDEKGARPFDEVVNTSVNQTIARSVNTSLTLLFVLAALFIFGSPSLAYFILAIAVGTVVGTYSSIFVASPLLTLWKREV